MTATWVVGGNGLLGSAIRKVLNTNKTHLFMHAEQFSWGDECKINFQLESALKAFVTFIDTKADWQIYWAAGIGSMGSTKEELEIETAAISTLVKLIESHPLLMKTKGSFTFASSAGAIYAGSTDYIITEKTPIAPTTAYAYEKLKQESIIMEFSTNNSRLTAVIARISTLYGAGSINSKRRGLITEIARRIARNQPMQIYVPLDTMRDYIFAEDAATIIINLTIQASAKPGCIVKIIASEQPVTIAEIVSIFKKVVRRPLRIVTSASRLSSIYSRRIQFRSVVMPLIEIIPKTSIVVGINKVVNSEKLSFASSS